MRFKLGVSVRVIVVLALAAGFTALFSVTVNAAPSLDTDRPVVIDALTAVVSDASDLCDGDMGWSGGRFCLMGRFMDGGSSITNTEYLEADKEYVFLVDNGVCDGEISITVKDQKGTVLDTDSSEIGMATAIVFAPEDGKYDVTVEVGDGTAECFCALGMFEDGGVPFSADVVARSISVFDAGLEEFSKDDGGCEYSFPRTDNLWTVLAMIGGKGASAKISGLTPGDGLHGFLASTGDMNTTISAEVLDSSGEKIKGEEDTGVVMPGVTTEAGKSYGLRITQKSSDDPAMVVGSILDATLH